MDGGYEAAHGSVWSACTVSEVKAKPPCPGMEAARKAACDLSVIAEILLDMSAADTAGVRPMQGPSVAYLAQQLRAALELIDPVLNDCP